MSPKKINGKLHLALNNLDSLPAMPEIAHRLLALPLDTEDGEAQMLRLIGQDPQLSAKIIGLANAAALGLKRNTNSIHDAAMLLGLRRLKSVAIGMSTLSALSKQAATKNFDPQDLWSHSMTIAIVMSLFSQEMPKTLRPNENMTFLAGLLHDIGLMALHHLDQEASDELHHQLRLQPKRPIQDIELELIGITHSRIGAQLVRHWNLPSEIIEVVALHHEPHSEKTAPPNLLILMVNIAERLLPDFSIAEHHDIAISNEEWHELGIEPARSAALSALVNEVAMQIVQLPDPYIKTQAAPVTPLGSRQQLTRTANYSIVRTLAKALTRWARKLLR